MFVGRNKSLNKLKNRGADAEDARLKWQELYAAPDAITDALGPTVKHAARVAIHTRDLITFRDKSERSQVGTLSDKDKKMSIEEGQTFVDVCLRDAPTLLPENEGREAIAQRMGAAAAAASAAGSSGAFGSVGRAASKLGSFGDLKKDMDETEDGESESGEEQQQPDGKKDKKDKESEAATPKKGAGAGQTGAAIVESAIWFNRAEKIMDAQRQHKSFETKSRTDLMNVKRTMLDTLSKVGPDVETAIEAELRLLKTRLRAIKLVLMEEDNVDGKPAATVEGAAEAKLASGAVAPKPKPQPSSEPPAVIAAAAAVAGAESAGGDSKAGDGTGEPAGAEVAAGGDGRAGDGAEGPAGAGVAEAATEGGGG